MQQSSSLYSETIFQLRHLKGPDEMYYGKHFMIADFIPWSEYSPDNEDMKSVKIFVFKSINNFCIIFLCILLALFIYIFNNCYIFRYTFILSCLFLFRLTINN